MDLIFPSANCLSLKDLESDSCKLVIDKACTLLQTKLFCVFTFVNDANLLLIIAIKQ